MVKLKFVVRNDTLVLRISEGKERFYRSASSVLSGTPNLARHWNQEKERFSHNAVFAKENNAAIQKFKEAYSKIALANPEMTAEQVATYFDATRRQRQDKPIQQVEESDYGDYVEKFLERLIEREKAKNGCNFEVYQKLLNKLRRLFSDFSSWTFREIDYDKCVEIASVFAQNPGYFHAAKAFRNLLGKASKDCKANFKISQIGDFSFHDYDPNKDEIKLRKPDVLSPAQISLFLNLDPDLLTPEYKDRNTVRLYYDFSVFMLHSMLAPCDVIKLKKSDITRKHTIVCNRKKTHRPVEIPISPEMDAIIARYSCFSKDGYIFPIMDDEKEREYKTRDYTFKKFRQLLNIWLKEIGKLLGTKFSLYAYVFRHTAITFALDNGLPISYIAIVAGTSIEMIQKHYYNGDNTHNSQKLQLIYMKAAGKIPV